jgi:hypothetical protein
MIRAESQIHFQSICRPKLWTKLLRLNAKSYLIVLSLYLENIKVMMLSNHRNHASQLYRNPCKTGMATVWRGRYFSKHACSLDIFSIHFSRCDHRITTIYMPLEAGNRCCQRRSCCLKPSPFLTPPIFHFQLVAQHHPNLLLHLLHQQQHNHRIFDTTAHPVRSRDHTLSIFKCVSQVPKWYV